MFIDSLFLNALPVPMLATGFFLLVFHWFYKVFWSPRASKLDLKLELCWSSSWEASWSDLGMVLEASWGVLGASWGVLGASWGVLGRLGAS